MLLPLYMIAFEYPNFSETNSVFFSIDSLLYVWSVIFCSRCLKVVNWPCSIFKLFLPEFQVRENREKHFGPIFHVAAKEFGIDIHSNLRSALLTPEGAKCFLTGNIALVSVRSWLLSDLSASSQRLPLYSHSCFKITVALKPLPTWGREREKKLKKLFYNFEVMLSQFSACLVATSF